MGPADLVGPARSGGQLGDGDGGGVREQQRALGQQPVEGGEGLLLGLHALDDGLYNWRRRNLPKRIAKRAVAASISTYFALPPKDFLYVMRKLMGVYALIAQLDARFDGEPVFREFLPG